MYRAEVYTTTIIIISSMIYQALTFNLGCAPKAFSKSASDMVAGPVVVKRATLEGRGGLREPVERVEPCVRALALLPQELTLSLSSYKKVFRK